MTWSYRRIVLASRPTGEPKESDFRLEEVPLPQLGPGQLLLRTLWLSVDPYQRILMNESLPYAPRVEIGDVMTGGTIAEVVVSNFEGFAVGDVVKGYSGWQEYAVADGSGLRKLDPALAPVSTALGVLGMPGLTAYAGLLEIGKPQPGETLAVAAAAGAVGSAVGQIAKIKGCRAVGIAGGARKCRHVVEELGFDACLDHRAPDLEGRLRHACPDGIDIYFETVGGIAKRAGYELVGEFYDAAVSGADAIDTRPGFAAMLKRIEGNGVKVILVETASRFARDLMVQEVGYAKLRERGIDLIAVDSPNSFLDDTPTAKLVRQVLGAIAEFDKAMTVAKLRGARERQRAIRGKCEGRKSHAERNPELVRVAKRLRRRWNTPAFPSMSGGP
jgi:NADPH-dependent curcumin reductase